MLGQSRIGTKALASLSRRLAISMSAGVDARKVWSRETSGAHGAAFRRHLNQISEAIASGSSVSDALAATGNFFPEFFREMVRVGEESGNLPEVFGQLAENYEQQLTMRRVFLGAITLPMVELVVATACFSFSTRRCQRSFSRTRMDGAVTPSLVSSEGVKIIITGSAAEAGRSFCRTAWNGSRMSFRSFS